MPGPFSSPCSPPVMASGPPAHFATGTGQILTAQPHDSSSLVPGRVPQAPAGSEALVDAGTDPGWGDQDPNAPDGPPAPFGGSTPGQNSGDTGGLTAGAWIGLAGLAAAGGLLVYLATRSKVRLPYTEPFNRHKHATIAGVPRFERPPARR